MIALDTSILARYFLDDDREQARAAKAALARKQEYWLPVSVLIELVWVLKSKHCTREEILAALDHLLSLPNIKPQLPEAIARARKWFQDGLDFPDALHLALSPRAMAFLSFDERLLKKAADLNVSPAVRRP